jgi:hypothetical protein
MAFPTHHQAPERLKRTWQINLNAESILPTPAEVAAFMGKPIVQPHMVPLEIFDQRTDLLSCFGILRFHPLQALDDAVQFAPEELRGGGLTPFVCRSGWSACCNAVI